MARDWDILVPTDQVYLSVVYNSVYLGITQYNLVWTDKKSARGSHAEINRVHTYIYWYITVTSLRTCIVSP